MRRPVSKRKLLALIQEFTAVSAVGASAVRGQPKNTVKGIREYLGKMNLCRMPKSDQKDFRRWLDLHTGRIQRKLPTPWGIARKALNLFLRSCFYTHDLRRKHGFECVRRWLEVPLDSVVARELRKEARKRNIVLPKWNGLGDSHLQDKSDTFQSYARAYAAACKLPATVYLDNVLWIPGRLKG